MAEFWLASDPGVPLPEFVRIPGTPMPVNGKLVAVGCAGIRA